MDKYKKSEITKSKIILQANLLFSKQGFSATGVDEIVETIGLTSGSFYAQFKSKLDVYDEVILFRIKKSNDFFLKARPSESASVWLQRVLSAYLSEQHVFDRSSSCPLSLFSNEILTIDSKVKVDLSFYFFSFTEILQRRLNLIHPENSNKAVGLFSSYIGFVQAARLKTHKEEAALFLKQAYIQSLMSIKSRDNIQMLDLK